MQRQRLTSIVAILVLEGAGVLAGACAESEGAIATTHEDAGQLPESDAASEASADAGSTDADASSRTCSDQGFCHTLLPDTEETLRGVWGDGRIVWAVSEEGDVLRWDGTTWKIHTSGLGALNAIWGSGPTDLWIGGERGLFHGTGTSSDVVTFSPQVVPGDEGIPIRTVWGRSASDVWATGGNTDVDSVPRSRVVHLTSVDGGAAWILDGVSSEPFAFAHVWGDARGGTWIAGDDGTEHSQTSGFYRRARGSSTFEPTSVTAYNDEEGPGQGGPGTLSAVGIGADGRFVVMGRTLSATPSFWYGADVQADGGVTWTYEARDLNDPVLRAAWGVTGGTTWVAGDYGRLRSRATMGWTQAAIMIADFPIIEPLYAMWGTSDDDFWIVGHRIAMHRVARGAP